MGLPVLRAFPSCVHAVAITPAQRLGVLSRSFPPAMSAFPESVTGSACATTFSRLAQRSLTLRPAHSPSHLMTLCTRGFSHFVTSMTAPIASGRSEIAGWDSHPLRNAALSRRTHRAVVSRHVHQVDTEDTFQTLRHVFRLGIQWVSAPPYPPLHSDRPCPAWPVSPARYLLCGRGRVRRYGAV